MKYTFALIALFFALTSTHPQLARADDMDDRENQETERASDDDGYNPVAEEESMEDSEIAEDESDEGL